MNVSRATSLWTLGVLATLSVGACEAVDHTVGEGTNDDPLNAAGAGASADESGSADESDSAEGGARGVNVSVTSSSGDDTGTGGAGNRGNGTVTSSSGVASAATDSVSNVGTSGDDTGTGGAGNGVNGTVNSSSGGASTTAGLPIPNSCTEVRSQNNGAECELEVECAGEPEFSRCLAVDGVFECGCLIGLPGITFRLTGVTIADACSHTLAACLNWPELDAEPFVCIPSLEVNEPGLCSFDATCMSEGVAGAANVTSTFDVQSDCSGGPSGWICGCVLPHGALFEFENATSDPQCLDARGWCAGVGVERTGNRACDLVSEQYTFESEGTCDAMVQCQRAVTLSGQEATMHEVEVVDCYVTSEGLYQCRCYENGPYTEVASNDLWTACDTAVSLCYGD